MSESLFLDISADGIAADHTLHVFPRPVAPATGDERNTLRLPLRPVGCALVPDHHFEFDSSLLLPAAASSFKRLIRLLKARPGCPLTVFGHADPVGRDRYNKTLSGRRALAVYATLIRDTDLWEKKLYKKSHGGDRWRHRAIQVMLAGLKSPATGSPYYSGDVTGKLDEPTRDAVEAFQNDHSDEIGVDRDPGPETRAKLFAVYMDFLCSDEQGQPFKLEKTDFLAQGADSKGKGDYQGCGEFNPKLLFSQTETDEFEEAEDKDARDEANAPNRRVLIFLFPVDTKVNPKKWPCPNVEQSGSGCRKRFWSDGEDRRSKLLQDERRYFQDSEDTFACRFYHGLAELSPCESALKLWVLRLRVTDSDGNKVPVAGKRFVLSGAGDDVPDYRGITDERGILRIPVHTESATMILRLDVAEFLFDSQESGGQGSNGGGGSDGDGAPGGNGASRPPPADGAWEDEHKFMHFKLAAGALIPMEPPSAPPVRQRLFNLGYGPPDPDNWDAATKRNAILAFQHDHDLPETGNADEPTRQRLKQEHGS